MSRNNHINQIVAGSHCKMSVTEKGGAHDGYMQQVIQNSAKKYPNIKSLIDKLDLTQASFIHK